MADIDARRQLLDRVAAIFDNRWAEVARSENRLVVVSAGGQCPLELEVIASYAVLTLGEEGECVLERGLRWPEDIIAASLSIAELGHVSPTVERLGTLRPGYVPYMYRDGYSQGIRAADPDHPH